MDEASRPDPGSAETDETLRAKYYDYCSARVADVLLGMSPDQIFLAAEEAARSKGIDGELSYEHMVRLATEQVSRRIDLPSFTEWVERYAQDPEAFEAELLGLWRSEEPSEGE